MAHARKRDLVGRRIVAVEMPRAWDPTRGFWAHSPPPTFILDNGARVTFSVEETEAEYGVRVLVFKRR